MDIAPGIPINQKQTDKVDIDEEALAISPQQLSHENPNVDRVDQDKKHFLKLQNVSNNSAVNINNYSALSGLKDHKLKDQKKNVPQSAKPIGQHHQRDHSNSSIASALNIAKTVQQSSIHQVKPGQRDISLNQYLDKVDSPSRIRNQRAKENEIQAKNPKLDLNVEEANMIDKINNEIMASVNNLKLANSKQGVVAGLPGNASVLNSNEHSSNSAPQQPIQKTKRMKNPNVVEAQHVHQFQTS